MDTDGVPVEHIGRYRVTRVLGQGGMGTVYQGYDERLDRPVAIKVVRGELHMDMVARERLRREARAAARVSHPNICMLYEFDESEGQPFLVMELLEGEPLSARLERGPIPAGEGVPLAATMLDALAALHRRGVIHRDLKPGNVFLTPHGPKLLDFGLAQPLASDDVTRDPALTNVGALVGTPRYMAPEQLQGRPADERADLFAAAAVIYEMFAGTPAFAGRTLPEIYHAVVYNEPAPLPSFPSSASIDRTLRRALIKDPAVRLARADEFASLLREAARDTAVLPPDTARPVTRFVALPLRVLRPDADTDFLTFSVPDAISAALASVEAVIVRSSPANVPPTADPRAIARDLGADVVLTGSILRAGAHLRVAVQLTDVAAGTLVCSDTVQAPIDDLFQLQDTITGRIVSALHLPLTLGDRRALGRQAPASAEAYELFMRANQLMTDMRQWDDARHLYERALAIDPAYAPAWAGLGRARRVLAKWGGAAGAGLLPEAEAAFRRALELNPDLPLAHDLSAYVDAERGRAPEAMARLIRRARERSGDAGVFAGLVTTCRYAGLLDASLAAHRRAQALDSEQPTSIALTHLVRGDYTAAIASDRGVLPYAATLAQLLLGTLDDQVLRAIEAKAGLGGARLVIAAYRHLRERDLDAVRADVETLRAEGFADPEGWYLFAFAFAAAGAPDTALELLARAVSGGYACHEALTNRTEWQSLRGTPAFDRELDQSARLLERARQAFEGAGGSDVLSSAALLP